MLVDADCGGSFVCLGRNLLVRSRQRFRVRTFLLNRNCSIIEINEFDFSTHKFGESKLGHEKKKRATRHQTKKGFFHMNPIFYYRPKRIISPYFQTDNRRQI